MDFHIDCSYISLNKRGEELCGDKVEIIRTTNSTILVLADGLGSGVKANILATLTSKIIGTMVRDGATIHECVETIANTLPVCSVRQLAYSTFSILQLFNNGEVYIVEFDNPACFFLRNNRIFQLPFKPLSLGGKLLRECRFNAMIDDVFVLVSDGVIHAGLGVTLNLGWQWDNVASFLEDSTKENHSATRISFSLSQVVDSLYMSEPGDDATIVVARIMPETVLSMLSGPPKDRFDDDKVVRKFMCEPGLKVICGGTSANIVSRVLSQPIDTCLDYHDISIPPTASIEGIDLTTEGVLTLSRTNEILKRIILNPSNPNSISEIDAKNGASKLARMLIENCTCFKLYEGTAINPAHQNPNLPVDLSIKLRLLAELCDSLKLLGKKVIRYIY